MAVAELERPKVVRGLPGATVLHIIPALAETPAARAAVDTAVALLRSGARVIVAAEDGPLNSELQGLGGEWVRLVTESSNPIATSRNARTIANLVATERVDLVHAVGIGASRSAAALKNAPASGWCTAMRRPISRAPIATAPIRAPLRQAIA